MGKELDTQSILNSLAGKSDAEITQVLKDLKAQTGCKYTYTRTKTRTTTYTDKKYVKKS